jgi:beta-lactam-binding protein with PASTA domain/predicted Ser/Thr protein kinase
MTQPRIIGSRYELGELIGYGGMAEVHRGRDTRLNREVAIKMLRPDLARDPSFLIRFRREAHSAAGLNHPSIVSVYDTGEIAAPDGTALPFIVMEHVEGRTLRDILKSEGRLPARRAMEITADVCAALDFSHRNGIVHRDIKPANVMITPTGAVKVMDFGIARALADTSATVTQTANVIGTAQYLSPEQARGEAVDARSDVYSTGCLLYELVAGVPPFQGDSPVAVAVQHVKENPVMPSVRNPEVPRVLDSVVMKALAKNQLNRYQSAADMRADLQRALANQPVTAESVMTDAERTQFIARTPSAMPAGALHRGYDPEPEEENHRRAGLIWAAVVVVLLVVIGVGAWWLTRTGGGGAKTVQVAVPPVIGQTPDAAKIALRHAGLRPEPGEPTSDKCGGPATVKQGNVCTITPDVGIKLDKGTVVTYHVYTQQMVNVPSIEGLKLSDALDRLHQAQLTAHKKKINNVEPFGTVVHQNPQPYVKTVPVGYKVLVEYSSGMIKLPDVVGQTYDKAVATLNARQFTKVTQGTPIITEVAAKNNIVAKEDPTPKNVYKPDQQVTLTVYQYQPPPPVCPTPTPPVVTGTPPVTIPPSTPTPTITPTGTPTCIPG